MRKNLLVTITALITSVTILNLGAVNAKCQPQDEVFTDIAVVHVIDVAHEFGIDPYLLASLVWQESKFIVRDNLTQITSKKWFKEGLEYCGSDDLSNEYVNIRCCGYYLAKWAEETPEEPALWLMCWNQGPESAKANYNPDRPSRYAREIMERAEEWREIYGKEK